MAQYNNPFTGVPVGWDDGEDGWGQPLNTTLLQYAFYHSRNVNGVVATVDDIPLSAANGSAYLVQENQRVYFASNLTWYFSVPPDGMKFRLVTDGSYYSKTSSGFVLDDEISEVAYSGDASDLTTGTLNVARTPAFTGDVTKPSGSATLTLSASGVTAGSYGATDYTYPTVTIDSKGRITSAANKTIPDASTTVKGLMSSADKTKLNSVTSGAEANVNADWNSATGDSQILNKPTLGNLSSVNATPVGLNLVQATNPTSSIVFPRINADNTVSLLNDVDMKAALNITGGGGGEGSVTSVGLTVPLGFSTTNSPITSAGNIGLTFATGYSLPTTAKQTNWDAAYGWGNHASAGYAVNGAGGTQVRTNTQLDSRYLQSFTETDPTVPSHVKSITSANITNWNTAYTDRNKWDGGSAGLNAATGRNSLGLGTASQANLVTSSTDTTADRVTTVGWMGLGASTTTNTVTLATVEGNQFGRVDAADPDNPAGSAVPAINLNISGSDFGAQILIARGNDSKAASGGIYYRGKNTTFSSMRKIWDSQNLVKTTSTTDTTEGGVPTVGWLGNGRTLAYKSQPTDDLNDFNVAGAHGMWGGNSLNRPTNNVYIVHVLGGSTSSSEGQIPSRLVQVAHRYGGVDESYHRSYNGSSWSAWQQQWSTGNTSADVQALLSSANNAAIRTTLNVSEKVSTSNSSSTTLSLTNAMEGVITRLTSTSTKTVNITTSLTVPDGQWHIRNVGTGNATLVAGTGVTINLPYQGSLVIPQGGTVTLQKVGSANEYDLIGQTVVA